MSKFRVTYPGGVVELVEQSDCETVEQFANTKFGYADYEAHGVRVELIDSFDVVNEQEKKDGELHQVSDQEAGSAEEGTGSGAGQEDSSQDA